MGADGKTGQVNDLFLQNEIIGNKIDKNIQQGVPAAASQVPEILPIQPTAERFVNQVQEVFDPLFNHAQELQR